MIREIEVNDMKRWIFFGDDIDHSLNDEIYVQFISNVFSAVVAAGMIGAYHWIFHV